MAAACPGVDSQDLATILDPFRVIFHRFRARPPICDLNIVTLPQLRLLRHQYCVLRQDRFLFLQPKTSVLSQQQTSVLSQQKTSIPSQQKTRQLPAPVAIVDICLVSTADICPVSAADICPVSTADICPVSTAAVRAIILQDPRNCNKCIYMSPGPRHH